MNSRRELFIYPPFAVNELEDRGKTSPIHKGSHVLFLLKGLSDKYAFGFEFTVEILTKLDIKL